MDLDGIKVSVKGIRAKLKPFITARQKVLSKSKLKNLLLPAETQKYGKSQHIKEVFKTFGKCGSKASLSVKEAIAARNYLMFMICHGNAARASNLIYMSLTDVENAEYPADYENARSVR